MNESFDSAFYDFLNEQMGKEVARLREKNERYASALHEYSELIQKADNNEVDDCQQAFVRLAELSAYIRDMESGYLFYAGMAARKRMDDAILSFAPFERLTE